MFKNYFKIAWRTLLKNKSFLSINITGLATAMASCILIYLFINNENSFDENVPDKNHTYRLNEYVHYDGTAPQVSAAMGEPIGPFLANNHPEIKSYARVYPATPAIYPSLSLVYNGQSFSATKIVCTDTSFNEMFGTKILDGDKKNFLRNQNNVVLTRSLANKIFGNASAIDKQLILHTGDSSHTYVTVSNVIADMPATSHLQFGALLPVPGNNLEDNYGALLGPTYLQLQAGVNIKDLETKFTRTIHSKNQFIDMRLQPISDVHAASTGIKYDLFNYNKIDGKYLKVFSIIALTIFLIACINFINLSTAIAGFRGKEIAMRKIAGASRIQIIIQIILETFIAVFIAILLAMSLASLFLPYINSILNRTLDASLLYQPKLIFFYGAALFATTFLSGLYPALLISSIKVNEVLRTKKLAGNSASSLRNILVTGQFMAAIIFIIGVIVMIKQLKLLQTKDLGYSYSQVIKMPLDMQDAQKLSILRSELVKIRGVDDVTHGYLELNGTGSLFGIDYQSPNGQQHISVNFENATAGYVKFFGMKIINGHDLTKNNTGNEYLINETLAKQIGWANPVGKEINLAGGWPPGVIAGIVKDFNYSTLHSAIEPLIIGNIDLPVFEKQLYIKLSTANVMKTISQVVNRVRTVTGNAGIDYVFLDDDFKAGYNSEKQASVMVAIVSSLAIIIACLGLLGLAAFIITRRTKEIGVRKVLGASVINITALLSKDFLMLVFIACLAAFPLSYWMMNKWLQSFAYRIAISWWVFVVATIIAIIIALLTVSFQAIRAAVANPVKSLRTE
jgi:putative ABC transport system permease protein